jgi:hypothetical protein
VQQGLNGPFVYLVGQGDSLTVKSVSATSWEGTQWLIDEGLLPGDKVVVDGAQTVGAGQMVRPIAYDPKADTTLAVHQDSTVFAPPSAAPPIRPTERPRGRPTERLGDRR